MNNERLISIFLETPSAAREWFIVHPSIDSKSLVADTLAVAPSPAGVTTGYTNAVVYGGKIETRQFLGDSDTANIYNRYDPAVSPETAKALTFMTNFPHQLAGGAGPSGINTQLKAGSFFGENVYHKGLLRRKTASFRINYIRMERVSAATPDPIVGYVQVLRASSITSAYDSDAAVTLQVPFGVWESRSLFRLSAANNITALLNMVVTASDDVAAFRIVLAELDVTATPPDPTHLNVSWEPL
jgi:hypothetical protein